MQRAGHYYANWDSIEAEWIDKAKAVIARLEALTFEPLPDMVPLEVVTGHAGRSNVYDLQHGYHELIDLSLELWQLHFEMLNLGYAAYLDYFGFCKQVFPSIPDLSIAKMVAGIEVDLFRPDEELRRLARLAVDSGLGDILCEGTVDQALATVAGAAGGDDVAGRVRQGPVPVVQLLERDRLLPHRCGVGGASRHPVLVHARLHPQAPGGGGDRHAAGGRHRRA